jgi:adenylylsulfate kinase
MNKKNIVWSASDVTPQEREKVLGQKGCILWLTGLSGSGKSTIARALEKKLISNGKTAYILDGDNIRHGLCRDLGFSNEDRTENIRRIGEVAALFAEAGIITITAFISPLREDRQKVRDKVPTGKFIEIFIDTPLETCEQRDPKGLYQKARKGEIPQFTGISSPYEAPEACELKLDTTAVEIDTAADIIYNHIEKQGFLRNNE